MLWSQEFCAKYQRTSSTVVSVACPVSIGRNGYLSKLHHARRRFSEQSLNIIHNFDLKRHDGAAAAQRLFSHEFPDLLEWKLSHVGELPLPRRSSKPQQTKPLYADVSQA